MISIEKNKLHNIDFTKIEHLVKHPKFNYSFNHKAEIVHFYHIFYFENKLVSPFAHVINPLIRPMKQRVHNAMLIVVPETSEKKCIFKKIVKPLEVHETLTGIYFINTNNGNFNLFNYGDISAEQNKFFLYDSNLEVDNYSCTDEKFKTYLQIEFINDYN
tara:strand:+ start:67 stop:546 length:480 start_codon:yes stop_codon:yes gene_type:complete